MKFWLWLVSISVLVTIAVCLITYFVWWSPKHRKTSSSSRSQASSNNHRELQDSDSDSGDVVDLSTLMTTSGSSSSSSNPQQTLLLYDNVSSGLLSVATTPLALANSSILKGINPVYDSDTKLWWYLDKETGRLAASSWNTVSGIFQAPEESFHTPSLETGSDTHVIIQHGWCLFFGATTISFWRLSEERNPFLWTCTLPGAHTGVILSDGTVVLLHQEKYKLYRVQAECWSEGPQEFYIEGVHQPQYLLPLKDEDAFVLSSALDERSFWIDASDTQTGFVKTQIFSHVATTLYHTSDTVWLADHTTEQIYTYDRHSLSTTATDATVLCSSSILSVPGGSHLQTRPPSGFGTSLLFMEEAHLLVVGAPYQHGIQSSKEEAGLLYVFFMERTAPHTFVYTPTYVLRSPFEEQQNVYHFGLSLYGLQERVFVYQDPGLLTSHMLWS